MTLAARLALPALLLFAAACSGASAEPAASPSPTVPPTEQGRALFRNKGCVTCHRHAGVEGETGLLEVGPDLTAYRNADTDFLRAWLADPQTLKPNTPMPDLQLTDVEIEHLIAFLNEPG